MVFEQPEFNFYSALTTWIVVMAIVIGVAYVVSLLVMGVLRLADPRRGRATPARSFARRWLVPLGLIYGPLVLVIVVRLIGEAALGAGTEGVSDLLSRSVAAVGAVFEWGEPAYARRAEFAQGLGPILLGALGLTYAVIAGAALARTTTARRVTALGWHTVRETVRNRVLLVLVVFVAVLLFAGWFLPRGDEQQEAGRAYNPVLNNVAAVWTPTKWIVLALAVLIPTLTGLAVDIKSRTIHTVVTKPVRRHEIVLGRLLGYTVVGTVILALMGGAGYLYVLRSTPADYRSDLTARVPIYATTLPDSTVEPLEFTDRQGQRVDRGISVGDEWDYRRYIEGLTEATAVWTFEELQPLERMHEDWVRWREAHREPYEQWLADHPGDPFDWATWREENPQAWQAWRAEHGDSPAPPPHLVFELNCTAFRTHKGYADERGELPQLHGSLTFINAVNSEIRYRPFNCGNFEIAEYRGKQVVVPWEYFDLDAGHLDLYEDVLQRTAPGSGEGRRLSLRVELACLDGGQFLGVARHDLYIRASDRSFGLNYAKGLLGIWMQMFVVLAVGVTAATVLAGPVAFLLTLGFLILGFAQDYLVRLTTGELLGGGPIESSLRMAQHMNEQVPLDENLWTTIMRALDTAITQGPVAWLTYLVPDLGSFDSSAYIAHGFNIPFGGQLGPALLGVLAFAVPVIAVGSFALRLREMEAK